MYLDDIYENYYWKRMEQLNQLFENIAHTEYLNKLEEKNKSING